MVVVVVVVLPVVVDIVLVGLELSVVAIVDVVVGLVMNISK